MTNKMKLRKNEIPALKQGFLFLLLFLFSNSLWASNPTNSKSIFDMMHYEEVLEMTLETDLTYLKENRRNEEYQKGNIQFLDKNKNKQNWDIKVRLRGNFRRMNCADIPPLKLKFKKDALSKAGLNEFNDMKLVTTCAEDKEEAKAALFKEYLAYKLYNSLTENSFRVQLLRITYKDSNSGKKTKNWGFLIEDTAQLRDRIGAKKITESFGLNVNSFEEKSAKTVALFEYMIGNADWSFETSKNIKIVEKNGKYIPIPYDFDFSGLVDVSYSIPNPDYGLVSVKERVFIGFQESINDLHATTHIFRGKRMEFEKLIKNFKPLIGFERNNMIEYLDSFFMNIDNVRVVEKTVEIVNATAPLTK